MEEVAPEMEVVAVDISNIDDESIDATSRIRLKNPFPAEINTNRINYEIYIDSIKVIEGAYNRPVEIASSDSTLIEIPMEILADPMKRVLDYFEKYEIDSAEYTMNITYEVDVPIAGENDFDMEFSKKLPAIHLPEVEIEDLDLNLLKSREGIDVVLQVYNPNLFPLNISNGSFSFIVEDELEVVGQMEDQINIPARETGNVAIFSKKRSGSMLETGWDFLFNQEDTRFNYHFSFIMESENEMLDNTNMRMNINGTLDEIANAL